MHNVCENEIYKSVKDSPNYRSVFSKVFNGTKKVKINNKKLNDELSQYGKEWRKVYSDGLLNGRKVSLHYFEDASGKVYNVKYKMNWSVIEQ